MCKVVTFLLSYSFIIKFISYDWADDENSESSAEELFDADVGNNLDEEVSMLNTHSFVQYICDQ